MEVKPGYKQTEVGVIPEEWQAKPLRLILSKGRLGGNYANQDTESEFPLMKMGNIARGYFDMSKVEFITPGVTPEDQHRLAYGDVLFNTRNTLELVGKIAIWRDELPVAYYNSNLMRLEFNPSEVCSNEYANYALNTAGSVARLRALATGTTSVAAIYTRDLMGLLFVAPPKREQRAIAEALSDVDGLLRGLDRLIAKRRDVKQAAMQQLLTGQIRLPGFHERWESRSLQEIVDFTNGKPHEGDVNEHGQYLLITLDSIGADGCLKAEHKRVSRYDGSLKKDDIVTVLSTVVSNLDQGNILGLCDLVPEDNKYVLNQRMGRLRMKVDGSPRFVCSEMNRRRDHFKKRGQGTSQKHIYRRDVDSLVIPFPTSVEQQAIAEVLTDMDAELAALEQRREKTYALKQAMMQELLTGKTRLI
jgi:type I restriction enzyme, S subunit